MHHTTAGDAVTITVRNLPPPVARAVRDRARKENLSLDRAVIRLLEEATGFLKRSRRDANEKELREFLASPRCNVPVIDDETSHRYAAIHDYLRRKGTPVSPNDLWIAATAAQHGLTVVTLNGDFDLIPQVLVRKFEPPNPVSPP